MPFPFGGLDLETQKALAVIFPLLCEGSGVTATDKIEKDADRKLTKM